MIILIARLVMMLCFGVGALLFGVALTLGYLEYRQELGDFPIVRRASKLDD